MNKFQPAADREFSVMHVYMRMIVNNLDGGLKSILNMWEFMAGLHSVLSSILNCKI